MSKARLVTDSRSRSACSRGSLVDGALERHRRRRVLRHELAQPVDLGFVGHLQLRAGVAQHAARLQGAEGDDLRDAVAAVSLLHVSG